MRLDQRAQVDLRAQPRGEHVDAAELALQQERVHRRDKEMGAILGHGHARVAHPHREVGSAKVERRVPPQGFERHFEHVEQGVFHPHRRAVGQ